MHEYQHSPKVILITGPRAAGKTTVAWRLRDELDYHHIWLDGINGKVRRELGIEVNDMYHYTPENYECYKKHLIDEIKGVRYKNIVFEGDAIRSLYIYEIFMNLIANYYGDYAVYKAFSLDPHMGNRHEQYMLREIQRIKAYIKQNAGKPKEEHEGDKRVRSFDLNMVPDPPGFERISDADVIVQWAKDNENTRHPSLPEKYADLIKFVADSETYTPFYQSVEVDNLRIIKGIFASDQSWANVMRLNFDFTGKTVADLGAMHGYFCFRAEELGAKEVLGLEVNPSSVEVAREIAKYRKSKCTFEVCDVTTDELPKRDIYLVMNMLHWIPDLEAFLEKLTDAADEIIMEVGETQIQQISKAIRPKGFKPVCVEKSHRPDKKIGQRYVFRYVRLPQTKLVPVEQKETAAQATAS
ncbi:methyltransferase domain-containing protein [Pseudodesulfovibrio sp. zrk46]|uniref:methyltransferase domain-containing protein n=1 Tax=Pseudodesulfovibrio sp. zrk46 TaxID=2725288 RepID=UPI0014494FF4|nr:methyltransferase domain-containing protein [Pseudodesulfovibrio sp. zrk46]QJB56433.1 methyltransferase domain-containing protein [Pseudodesulfovibrio sp. zrk46]